MLSCLARVKMRNTLLGRERFSESIKEPTKRLPQHIDDHHLCLEGPAGGATRARGEMALLLRKLLNGGHGHTQTRPPLTFNLPPKTLWGSILNCQIIS